jgi:hypothetical protein
VVKKRESNAFSNLGMSQMSANIHPWRGSAIDDSVVSAVDEHESPSLTLVKPSHQVSKENV